TTLLFLQSSHTKNAFWLNKDNDYFPSPFPRSLISSPKSDSSSSALSTTKSSFSNTGWNNSKNYFHHRHSFASTDRTSYRSILLRKSMPTSETDSNCFSPPLPKVKSS